MQQLFQALQEANRKIAELKAAPKPVGNTAGVGTPVPPLQAISRELHSQESAPVCVAESAVQGQPIARRHGMPTATNLRLYIEETRDRMCMEAEDHEINFYPSFEKRILVLHAVISENYVVSLLQLKEAMQDQKRIDTFKRVWTQWKNERAFYIKRAVLEALGVAVTGLRASELHIDVELKCDLWDTYRPVRAEEDQQWGAMEAAVEGTTAEPDRGVMWRRINGESSVGTKEGGTAEALQLGEAIGDLLGGSNVVILGGA
ncbi:unnamed protein product [Closterium sp. NIES-65]|nr:unnamed protein product [Closterium sp. NIES-65]CAI5988376.1 unnamed protein product [Closterium sp. NIES-65]CAI5997279.1 unnamed protein product [Closterium sp. NIES-65]